MVLYQSQIFEKNSSCDNRVICKVLKDNVPILGLSKETSNTKRHDMHFPKAKRTKVNSKLAFQLMI
jgi:hypothetical protein